MSDSKEKSNKPHVKVYFETKEEVEEVKELAKTQGLSASAWFRIWAIREIKIKKGGK